MNHRAQVDKESLTMLLQGGEGNLKFTQPFKNAFATGATDNCSKS